MTHPIRLTVVMTHPIQYYSPWFRYITSEAPEIALTVLYVSEPSQEQQGTGFGTGFQWDVPLREGHNNEVLRPAAADTDFASDSFWGVDCPGIGGAIASTQPDAVLLSGWHSVSLVRAMFACRRRGIPLLYRGDTHLGTRARSKVWGARTRFLLRRFQRYLSVGARSREYLRCFGVEEAHIYDSPHAIDNAFFATRARPYRAPRVRGHARKQHDIPDDAFVVLFVGKIDRNKRVEDLIDALPLMDRPPVLVVVGRGPSEPACRARAQELEVNVRFWGFVNQSELGHAYGISDCLVLPSACESWGLVVNESMACGLPCVVSDRVGCAPDLVIEGQTGEVYPFGDKEQLARALERVRDDGSRARACEERVEQFSFRASTRGLVQACRDVVA